MGLVEREKATRSKETTPAGKRFDESPNPSKKKSSSKPTSDNLKILDDKWSQSFARHEAMLLAKSFTVPVQPVKKTTAVVTSDKPFFDPGASPSMMSVTQPAEDFTGASTVQATGDVTATQPVEAPSTMRESAATMTATQPVEVPGTGRLATQPVEAAGARTATQPVEASGDRTDVHPQPTHTGSGDGSAVDRSHISGRTVAHNTGVSDIKDELCSELKSPDVASDQEVLSDRDPTKDDELDQELSEEAKYRETMKGVRSFMGWHQIPDFDSLSSSQDNNPFAGSRAQPTGKVSIKLLADDWLCRKLEKLNIAVAEGYPSKNAETAGLLRDQFVKTPRTFRWYSMHTDKKDSGRSTVCHWSPYPAKLNSSFSRVARHSLPSAPASRSISQDTLRKWERSAREQTVMCNQAAGLSRCLTKVYDAMIAQLKTLHSDKGKASGKLQHAVDELDYLVTFNRSITQAMAHMIQDLSRGYLHQDG